MPAFAPPGKDKETVLKNNESITEKYEKYRTECTLITSDLMKHAKNGGVWTARQRFLEKRLVECEKILHETEAKIYEILENVLDSRIYNLLEARIFMNLTWEEIADSLECSIRTVYRLRRAAYKEFDKIAASMDIK